MFQSDKIMMFYLYDKTSCTTILDMHITVTLNPPMFFFCSVGFCY